MRNLSLSAPVQSMIQNLVEHFITTSPITDARALVRLAMDNHMKVGKHYGSYEDLYDIAEYALNNYAINYLTSSIIENIDLMSELQKMLPTYENPADRLDYNFRSAPLVIGYLISILSRPSASDIFLDPSAGTGGLATFINRTKSRIIVNEVGSFRYQLPQSNLMYSKVFNEDDCHIHEHPKFIDAPVSKVIVNPRVSMGKKGGKEALMRIANSLLSSYQVLKENGTMIALLNCEFNAGCMAFKHFLKNAANVRVSLNAELDLRSLKVKEAAFRPKIMIIHNYDLGIKLYSPPTLNLATLHEYLDGA